MEPEPKRHTMSHPPDHVADVDNNIGKTRKSTKNEKKKVLLNFYKYFNIIKY